MQSMLVSGWRPNLLPLLGHYVADEIAGSDGDAVSSWSRASGCPGVPPAWTASLTARPTLKRSIMNGHSVVRFDGVTNVLRNTYTAPDTALTLFVAFTVQSAFAGMVVNQIIELVAAGSANVVFMILNLGGYQPYSWAGAKTGAGNMVGIADTPDTSAHSLIVTYDGGTSTATGSYTAILDGTAKTVAASSGATRSSADKTAMGAFVPGSDVATSFIQIDIAEVGWCAGALTTGQSFALDKYLRNRYGL